MDGITTSFYGTCVTVLCLSVLRAATRQLEPKELWLQRGREALKSKAQENYGVAKNVILFIGDGMGMSTVTAMRWHKGQKAGRQGEEEQLNFDCFQHVGLSKVYNTDHQTPDSAGTATAYMTGVKTRMGVIGLDDRVPRGDWSNYNQDTELKSILNMAEEIGKDTGIVTTARVTHASPAAGYAKIPERNWEDDSTMPPGAKANYKDIASQLVERGKNIKVVLGGGRANFRPETTVDEEYSDKKGQRKDNRDLVQEWKDSKTGTAEYVWKKDDFDRVDASTTDYLLGLFEHSHMQFEIERNKSAGGEPSIAEMTKKAIEMLKKNTKGYVLFVEGGRIDHGHHAGQAQYAISEGVAFEEAVQVAIDNTDIEDTLIIVTGDHSHTMTIGGYASRGHNVFDKTDHGNAADGKPYTSVLYANGPGRDTEGTAARPNLTNVDTIHEPKYVQQAAVPLDLETHAAEDVPIYARGPMSQLIHGVQEQSYIAHVIALAACMGEHKNHWHCSEPKITSIGPFICVASKMFNYESENNVPEGYKWDDGVVCWKKKNGNL